MMEGYSKYLQVCSDKTPLLEVESPLHDQVCQVLSKLDQGAQWGSRFAKWHQTRF